MYIYRVQDRKGRGPWKPGWSHNWVEPRPEHQELAPLISYPATWMEYYIKYGVHPHLGSGCRSLEQLRKWITKSEYKTLRGYRYHCVKMWVDEILLEDQNQVAFARTKPLRKDVERVALWEEE